MGKSLLPKIIYQIIAALLCAIYGFLAGGGVGFVFTIFVYGIGAFITAPAGAALGIYFGLKTRLRDAVLLMSGWIIGLYLGKWTGYALGYEDKELGSFILLFMQILSAAAGGIALFFAARKWLTAELRFHMALSLSIFWTLCFLIYLYRWLYVWEP